MSGKLSYLPQLDGLRAIAVIIVIIFHSQPAWLPGGFVGVDVFFFLSGFLITQIVIGSLESGWTSPNKSDTPLQLISSNSSGVR